MLQYKELDSHQKKIYSTLISIYKLVAERLDWEDEDQFNNDLRTLQELLNIELFTEQSSLDHLTFNYIAKFGNPFYDVIKKPDCFPSTYIQLKEQN